MLIIKLLRQVLIGYFRVACTLGWNSFLEEHVYFHWPRLPKDFLKHSFYQGIMRTEKKKIFSQNASYKVENILNGSLDLIPSPSPSMKIQIMDGKVCLRFKCKTLLDVVNKLLKKKVCWHHPAMFCLITSSKLSCQ